MIQQFKILPQNIQCH